MVWLSVALILGIQITPSLSQGPNDVVTNSGHDVTFTYSNDAMQPTDYYRWYRFPPLEYIYTVNDSQPSNPHKYSIDKRSFSMIVNQVTTDDTGTYCFSSRNTSCANLVVIDKIISSIEPPSRVPIGQVVKLTCQVNYGSPTIGAINLKPLSPGQVPMLSMFIGNTQITNICPGQYIIGPGEFMHSKSISVYRTIMANDVGQYLTCQVNTASPVYLSHSSTFLNVKSGTRNGMVAFKSKEAIMFALMLVLAWEWTLMCISV